MQLYTILQAQPAMVVHEATKYYAGNAKCLAYWLIPKSQEVEYHEVKDVLTASIKRGGASGEEMARFYKLAEQYHSVQTSGHPMAVKECVPYLFKFEKAPRAKF